MRICHLIYDDVGNPWLGGGGAVRAREIYRRLAERHEITLITGNFPGAQQRQSDDGIEIVRVGSESGYVRSRLSYCVSATAELRRRDWDVWVNEFSAYAPLRTTRQLRSRGVLLFFHFMGSHALRKHPFAGGAAWWAERRVLGAYQHIITVSPSVRQAVERRIGKSDVHIDCVVNGVDARYFQTTPLEDSFILYLGRLDIHTKGIDLLLEAFARLAPDYPEIKLKLVGRGDAAQLERVGRLIEACDVRDRVEAVGAVSEAEKTELLSRALFSCVPSRYEGWGMTAVEAAASAKAVVGTRIDGLRDAIVDGETGLLVEPQSPEAIEAGMRRLLDDDALRLRLGTKGREWARQFDWDQLAQQQEAVLQRAASASPDRREPDR